ncbi:acyl-CoA thioesterase domain-containing protein [Streptomyces sp. NPDC047315]|uniref:acyl-CoA thioesterase n=1 Tax=Streptomyces sp. NPDC047315 TaxID=3155142 RepID=UPI0033F79240
MSREEADVGLRVRLAAPVPGALSPVDADLGTLLHVERAASDIHRGHCHEGAPRRAYGGQVAAQALIAAGRTVPADRTVHSLHGNFLRAGDAGLPVDYRVERLRDGRSYHSRRVTAVQHGEIVFTGSASFKRAEAGPERRRSMPETAGPDAARDLSLSWADADPQHHEKSVFHRVLDLRLAEAPAPRPVDGETEQRLWIRSAAPLPDDPLLHAGVLAYASDLWLAPTAALAVEPPRMLRGSESALFLTSLDHAIWYHRPFRADAWMLFAQRSPWAGDGRGLVLADVWSEEGHLLASVVQETVLRHLR